MQIKEKQLRKMIRSALLSEITDFGTGRIGASAKDAIDCPYYTEIPEKLASLFNSTSSQEFIQKLSERVPRLGKDFEALGVGQTSRQSGITKGGMNPADIGSVTKSDNAVQILAGYFNSYLYVIGFGCLQYYYLTLILDFLAKVLGVEDAEPAAKKGKDNDKNYGRKFINGIKEKTFELSSRKDRSGFVNNYCFYALPNLSDEGPNSDNLDELDRDLDDYQKKIDSIRSISHRQDPSDAFREICDILDIQSTSFYEKLKDDLDGIEDNPELTEELKRKAVADMLIALGEAKENFSKAEETNPEFASRIKEFFTRNT